MPNPAAAATRSRSSRAVTGLLNPTGLNWTSSEALQRSTAGSELVQIIDQCPRTCSVSLHDRSRGRVPNGQVTAAGRLLAPHRLCVALCGRRGHAPRRVVVRCRVVADVRTGMGGVRAVRRPWQSHGAALLSAPGSVRMESRLRCVRTAEQRRRPELARWADAPGKAILTRKRFLTWRLV
jgi:hypothetical protein